MPLNHAGASRLYSLPPQGIGTAFVESLIGYIARLAEAHSVHTGTLVVRELREPEEHAAPLPAFFAKSNVGLSLATTF